MNKKFWLRTQTNPYYGHTDATVLWTIDMGQKETVGQSILSPSFRVHHRGFKDKVTKWQIQVFPSGDFDSHSQDEQVSVFLHGSIGEIKKERVNVNVSIVDSSLNRFAEKTLKHQANTNKILDNEDTCYGESNYCRWWDLQEDNQYENIKTPGGTLTFAITLHFMDGEYMPQVTAEDERNKDDSQTKGFKEVSGHFGKLLENKEFCDMEIDCGGKVFSCHKLIVSARSPVFRAMFDVKMKERESGKVTIEDIKPEIMEEMLHFIYTGVVKESLPFKSTVKLLSAADKYQLDALKDICQDKLYSVLGAENAIEILILGEMYRIPKLKDAALMEVVHNMPEIADTEDYQRLEDYPKLALEIPKAMFK